MIWTIFCDKSLKNNTLTIFDESLKTPRFWNIPHVSVCIQQTWFIAIPCIFFFLCLPNILHTLHVSNNNQLKLKSPITFRIINYVIIQIAASFVLIIKIKNIYFDELNDFETNYYLLFKTFQYFTSSAVLLIMIACRNRGVTTSGVLFNFWLLSVVFGLPEFYYQISNQIFDQTIYDLLKSLLNIFNYILILITLFLSCFADKTKLQLKNEKNCPENSVSFLNQITFHWFTSIALLGHKRALEMDDLWEIPEKNKSKYLRLKFDKIWNKKKNNSLKKKNFNYKKINLIKNNDILETHKLWNNSNEINLNLCENNLSGLNDDLKKNLHSIIWSLVCMFKWTCLSGGFYKLCYDLLQFVSPQLLKYLIAFIQNKNQPLYVGVGISISMFFVALIQSMVLHQYFHKMFRLGMNVRAVLSSIVYRKALLLANSARQKRTIGEIVNLLSIDVQRFQDITAYIMLFWSSPLQIILAIFFLYQLLNVSVLVGVGVLIALLPFNYFLSKKMRKYQTEQMRYKDERLKIMAELLNGIKILKLYAWEESMQKAVLDIRKREKKVLCKLAIVNAFTALTWACAPFLVAVLTFGVYVKLDEKNNILTPQITFVGLSLFNILRFPLAVFPMIFSQAMQCSVSNTRLKNFFAEEEIDENPEIMQIDNIDSDKAIFMHKASFAWNHNDENILNNISLDIKKGQLVAVVGQVGSGKSSLLLAILGNMYRRCGVATTNGKLAYVQQQPWIQNMSLANNILFGKPINANFYLKVLDACALNTDLMSFSAGDQTEIGEKGLNLSGGQKQRVSLARAVYANCDIYLLDDPLASVDAHVGKQLFEKLISSKTGLLKNKTRIFVTHSLPFLKHCDQIIVLKNGQIWECGTFDKLMKDSGEFSDLIKEFLLKKVKNSNVDAEKDVEKYLTELKPTQRQEIIQELLEKKYESTNETTNTLQQEKTILTQPLLSKNARIIEKENIETGKVNFKIYLNYIRAISFFICGLFLIIYLFSSVIGILNNFWLADWSDHAYEIQTKVNNSGETHKRLLIYTSFGISQAFCVTIGSIIMSLGMVNAGIFLHEKMLKHILRAPISFFDVTPIGRILNRFGKDVDAVDTTIPHSLITFIRMVFFSTETIIFISVSIPSFVLVVIPLAFFYGFILRFYVSTSRQLKRLDSITKSPIFAHFQESIQGAYSIRAFKVFNKFLDEFEKRVDYNFKAYFPSLIANRWLAVRLEFVGNIIVLSAALFSALFRNSSTVTAGLAGLSVSYALSITQTLNWAIRMTSELEANIVSVERIEEYTETIVEASPTTKPDVNLPENWPQTGEILIKNLELKYRSNLEPVLKDINVHINSKEKIGIVGRTGAGKSSFTLALFRLIEPSKGTIFIDNFDIKKIGLKDLRSRLTIVSQDPIMFSGTLRQNLDPFNLYDDATIWQALKSTYLDKYVNSLNGGLQHRVSESGSNFSTGQSQLICLARALLRKSKVIILDEAAASIDIETDYLIQKTISEKFSNCTVLTIAHRIQSILESDRIMVFENGSVVEFDTPKNLFDCQNSIFRKLALDAGIKSIFLKKNDSNLIENSLNLIENDSNNIK